MEQEDIKKYKLLVVEDNAALRKFLKIIFSADYDVILAGDGQQGIETAFRELPDLILCDVMMPVKDGFKCCREIKENPRTCHIPVILLTAKVDNEDIVYGTEMGADDYLLKPFSTEVLKAKVSNLIRTRMELKQIYLKQLSGPEEQPALTAEAEFIKSLAWLIQENIAVPDFGVQKLTELLGISQPTLYRRVKHNTGLTIVEMIRGIRMERAALLIKQQKYTIQVVAGMVGYSDMPTFRKHFTNMFGTTPSNYATHAEDKQVVAV